MIKYESDSFLIQFDGEAVTYFNDKDIDSITITLPDKTQYRWKIKNGENRILLGSGAGIYEFKNSEGKIISIPLSSAEIKISGPEKLLINQVGQFNAVGFLPFQLVHISGSETSISGQCNNRGEVSFDLDFKREGTHSITIKDNEGNKSQPLTVSVALPFNVPETLINKFDDCSAAILLSSRFSHSELLIEEEGTFNLTICNRGSQPREVFLSGVEISPGLIFSPEIQLGSFTVPAFDCIRFIYLFKAAQLGSKVIKFQGTFLCDGNKYAINEAESTIHINPIVPPCSAIADGFVFSSDLIEKDKTVELRLELKNNGSNTVTEVKLAEMDIPSGLSGNGIIIDNRILWAGQSIKLTSLLTGINTGEYSIEISAGAITGKCQSNTIILNTDKLIATVKVG